MFYFMVVFITIIILLKHFRSVSRVSIRGKHVVITGGSSGIGKSVAIVAAQEGAHVTIIARNLDKLEKARDEIMRCCINDAQIISRISVDVSNYEDIKDEMFKLEERISPIFMLVNCAGVAICGRVEDFTEREVKRLFDANFLGTFYPVKVILPKFKQRKEGIIVLTGSQVSLMGMYGYSIYSSFKFALRGFAESLYMESKSYGITVTLALPPDTDTPGYELENRSKPIETKLISAAATLAQPDEVAKNMMDDALKGRFFSYTGFESFILTTLCVGMSPFYSYIDVLVEAVLLGPLRLISVYYQLSFYKIIQKCYLQRNIQQ